MASTVRPLEGARERDLWFRFSRQRDPAAREELVRAYLPLAERMARRYAGIAEPYDDLFQVASLGLVNAVDRFDPARGTPFVGFAKPTILGEIKRYFRDKAWTVRVPRSVHDLMGRVDKATEELSLKLHRPPSIVELSRLLGADPSAVLEAMEAREKRRPLSLDASPATDDEEEFAVEFSGGVDPGYKLAEERIMLAGVLPGLTVRERVILRLRFVDELPQARIAERLGCSQMHVSRLLRAALERLRELALERGEGRPEGQA
jgi:RNA polymerase sigma-B factor